MRVQGLSFAAAFMTSVSYFLRLEIGYIIDSAKKTSNGDNAHQGISYDFIIGGGTSGCIMARRLSRKYRVLLLEAGPPPPSLVRIAALIRYVGLVVAPINSFYSSIPQKEALNRTMPISFGTMLGGSFSHNGMIWNRGSHYDYDNWAEILEDPSFNNQNMQKYFKKLESFHGNSNKAQRGRHGLMPIETEKSPLRHIWFAAGRELGYSRAPIAANPVNSFAAVEVSRRNGRRCTTYTEYIEPILSRRNLHVIPLAVVDRIEFSGMESIGVVYHRHGKKVRVKASREIILTAGSFGSALILFKSGLGPRDMLEEANIPVVADLPIGQGFEDHPEVRVEFKINKFKHFNPLQRLKKSDVEKYLKREHENVLSRIGEGPQGFIVSSLANSFKGNPWPDIQFHIAKTQLTGLNQDAIVYNARPAYDSRTAPTLKLNITAYKDGARDAIKLAIVDYKTFQNDKITSTLVEGLKILRKVLGTKAFKSIGAEIITFGPCAMNHKLYSDAYWRCYLQNNMRFGDHPVGTCRMAKLRNDDGGVVDRDFRVFGVSRLRVADASVFPKITSMNINAAIAAIAEKAAETILNQHKQFPQG